MKVHVLFFASTRELTGLNKLDIEIEQQPFTTTDLKIMLQSRFPGLNFENSNINIAINRKYEKDEVALKDGDQIALIPPIAGG